MRNRSLRQDDDDVALINDARTERPTNPYHTFGCWAGLKPDAPSASRSGDILRQPTSAAIKHTPRGL